MKNVLAIFFALTLLALPGAAFAGAVESSAQTQIALEASSHAHAPIEIIERARALKLANDDQWRRLVHYRHHWYGGWKSEADGQNFFVASDGQTNPSKELEATLDGFYSTEKRKLEGKNQPAQTVKCQFPARFAWLASNLDLKSVPSQTCPEWIEFRDRVAAKSATLVFSSFYAGNPSSTYGHSLMRLNKSDGAIGSEPHQLLDTGVNYAADAAASNPVVYAISGLAGFFRGSFTDVPYFYKVREYGDFESRDLWEYDLDLTPVEVSHVVEHLWELGSTYFNYYYLTQNCSYHMMTLIEAAAPRTHLLKHVPFWVIPTDSVKAFFDDHLVRKTNFRASLYSQFKARKDRLTFSEERVLRDLVDDDRSNGRPATLDSALSDDPSFGAATAVSLTIAQHQERAVSRAKLVDAYMDYVDLHYAHALLAKDESVAERKEKILIARSRLPMTAPLDFSTPPISSPSEGHPSARAMVIRAQNQNDGGATDFDIRFAFHDLIDPPKGYLETSDIDFFHLDLRLWDQPSRLRVQGATLFGVGTYPPLDPYLKQSTWRGKIGLQNVDDPRCLNCLTGGAWGGYGYSINIARPLQTYAVLDAELLSSPDFSDTKFSFRAGPTLGLRVRFSEELAWLTEANYSWAVTKPQFDDYKIESRLRLVPGNSTWGLDLHGIWRTENREVALGLLHYF